MSVAYQRTWIVGTAVLIASGALLLLRVNARRTAIVRKPPPVSPAIHLGVAQPRDSVAAASDVAASDAPDDAVVDSLLNISDVGLQTHWLNRLAEERAAVDAPRAAVWLANLPATLDRRDAIAAVMRKWSELDASGAAQFALGLPAGEVRQSGLVAAVSAWLNRDVAAATAWANRLDMAKDFDGVAGLIATLPALLENRPEVAAGWAESISDPNERRQRLTTVVHAWLARDPAAALRYLDATPRLTAFDRRTVRDSLGLDPDG